MPINKNSKERINLLLSMMKANEYPNHTRIVKKMRLMDIAGAYNISAKTIQRDILYLKTEFNAPIQYDHEHKGYYMTNPYWEQYVPFLAEEEMDAAIIGARLAETIMSPSRVRRQIREGTDNLWSRNNGSGDDFMVLSSLVAQGNNGKIIPEIFQTVFEAWQKHLRLQLKYKRVTDGHILDMTVEPHVLALHDNVWYTKAKLIKTGEIRPENDAWRVLALHRIQRAVPGTIHFVVNREIVEEVNAGFLFDLPRLPKVKLRISGSAANYGLEYLPIAERTQNPDDSLTVTLYDIEEYRVLNYVLCSGGAAIVIAPESLKQRTLDMAKNYVRQQEETK